MTSKTLMQSILDDNFEDYVEFYRALSRADSERLIEND